MQKIVTSLFLCALLFLPQWTEAQSSEIPLDANSRALQFQVNPNFQLSRFQGSLLSYKHHTSSTTAYRVGASLNLRLRDDFAPNDQEAPSRNDYLMGLVVQYLTYLEGESELKPYFGTGPSIGYSRNFKEEPRSGVESRTQTRLRIGVNGMAGVEWFVWSNVSFTAEYGAQLLYMTEGRTTVSTGGGETEESRTSWRIGGRGVTFGISAYF